MVDAPPAVLLCGGLGLRQRSDGDDRPKPLRVLGDGRPLLQHVLDYYLAFGVREFVLCVGYGAAQIERALIEAYDATEDSASAGPGSRALDLTSLDARLTLVHDPPAATKSARLLHARGRLGRGAFLIGYCDVLSDLDLWQVMDVHRAGGGTLTLTAARARSRYGIVQLGTGTLVDSFAEKPVESTLVSAGYFVAESRLFDELSPELSFEADVVPRLTARHEVHAYVHDGLWLALDTYKDFVEVDSLIMARGCPWLTPV